MEGVRQSTEEKEEKRWKQRGGHGREHNPQSKDKALHHREEVH